MSENSHFPFDVFLSTLRLWEVESGRPVRVLEGHMEIEFKNDQGAATGKNLYLQPKSGRSHLRERKRDEAEIFEIEKERHESYWMNQAFPVMLDQERRGRDRWMEIREWLRRKSEDGRKRVRRIVFEGERFDVMSVRRWRDRMLG